MNQRTGFAAVLWSSCLAMLAVGANGTAIMAALPTMQTELFLSSAGVQWAVNAYLVVSAACIVLGGRAADRFGARLASMVGLALFGVASCIIAAAGTQTALLAGRALQGLAAAFAVPSTLAAVDTSAAPERRGAAIGAWTGFLMLGFSIGPLLGGALTHITGWRVIFWLNIALMLVAIAGLAPRVRRPRVPMERKPGARTGRALFCWPCSWCRWSLGCMHCRTWGRHRSPLSACSYWRRPRSPYC